VDPARVQTIVLAAGSSLRMGWDKLIAPFEGVPLARRVVAGLADLRPIVVAAPPVAAVLGRLHGIQLILTEPTAGPSVTLALANAAVPPDLALAVVACDLPFLDAPLMRAFLERVPAEADLAYPVVAGTPGHPVVWSPKARARIAALRADEAPARVRRDPALRVIELVEADDGYVFDVDTPGAWSDAEARAARAGR
jgi:CTP:molybdopterin cytidylyltransferase MocA